MTKGTREVRRRQLMAAVSMLSVSLGMSSAAVADQIKGEAAAQKVTPGTQSSDKVRLQSSIKGETVSQKVTPGSHSSLKRGLQDSVKGQ
ncbi:MAG TPA: hypothetical protein VN814_17475 [Caulobacteraceae bacterium]|nr:hypothetical protein [Caulobacteraceae bacterium]